MAPRVKVPFWINTKAIKCTWVVGLKYQSCFIAGMRDLFLTWYRHIKSEGLRGILMRWYWGKKVLGLRGPGIHCNVQSRFNLISDSLLYNIKKEKRRLYCGRCVCGHSLLRILLLSVLYCAWRPAYNITRIFFLFFLFFCRLPKSLSNEPSPTSRALYVPSSALMLPSWLYYAVIVFKLCFLRCSLLLLKTYHYFKTFFLYVIHCGAIGWGSFLLCHTDGLYSPFLLSFQTLGITRSLKKFFEMGSDKLCPFLSDLTSLVEKERSSRNQGGIVVTIDQEQHLS